MKEVEILVQVFDKKKVLASLKQFKFLGIKKTKDVYFYDPLSKDMNLPSPTAWLRLRTKEKKHFLAYKKDVCRGKKWIYSDEYEIAISDVSAMENILKHMGFKKLIILNNKKHTYLTKEYEIVFEEVKGLGTFLEVEKLHAKGNVEKIKKEIRAFISNLGIKAKELNVGKPELMLRKK